VTDAPANRLEATMQAEIESLRREVEALRGEREEAREGHRRSIDLWYAATKRAEAAEAALSEARADAERLRVALAGLLSVAWPAPDEGHTGFVDRLGMQFYRETGLWPHFKSAPMEVAREENAEETRRRWSAWLESKRDAAAAEAARALPPPSPRNDGLCGSCGQTVPLTPGSDGRAWLTGHETEGRPCFGSGCLPRNDRERSGT
jgi:hypothetical protein